MADLKISLLQALQLTALLPCFFVVAMLLLMSNQRQQVVVPVGYFLCLACSFLFPLLPLVMTPNPFVSGLLLVGQNLEPALCFLLIIQFISNRVPPPVYWLILALPLLGGSSLLYGMLVVDEVCLAGHCLDSLYANILYQAISTSLILLLLVVHFSRRAVMIAAEDVHRAHKYWLVIALILLNIVMVVVDLALLKGDVERAPHALIETVVRMSFIYLALTSLFRVFDRGAVVVEPVKLSRYRERPVAPELIERLVVLMEQEHLFREMGMGREMLATKLGVSEHMLSKAVNQHFGRNLNEYINQYRVEEAKQRLRSEGTPVTAIAFEVGFSSIASFNRVFKSLVGQSPTEYRIGGAGG